MSRTKWPSDPRRGIGGRRGARVSEVSRTTRRMLGVTGALLFCCAELAAQDPGEVLFNRTCVACHTIGGGKLIGPDLRGIAERRAESWIISFVQSSQTVIADGDTAAAALFARYNQLPMPDHPLSDDDVRAIIRFIAGRSEPGATPVRSVDTAPPATADDVQRGQDLFVGWIRFENGGPTCNSCHNASTDVVMMGGSLGKDLTHAFSTLSGPGVRAMIKNNPSAVMRSAFADRQLTEKEVMSLAAFLESVEAQASTSPAYGVRLPLSGLAGLLVLLGLLGLAGAGRAKQGVNQEIFRRQIRST